MNWDQIEGKWKQLSGFARKRWGKLKNDDIQTLAGQRDCLVGNIQKRHGIAKADAEKQADHWSRALKASSRKMMCQRLAPFMKLTSIPVLLTASIFAFAAGRYEPLLAGVVMVAAIRFAEQAIRSREYSWAAGLVAIVAAFSPLFLAAKIFFVMGLICIATLAALVAAFRTQPSPVA